MDLTVKDLCVSIGKKQIVDKISLKVDKNSFVALLGPNGSGKSTLLRSIYRTLKPDSGIILLDGSEAKQLSNKKIAENMAVVGQFNNINFDFTVREVVMMGRTPHLKMLQPERSVDYEIVEEALQKVGMYDFVERSFSSLSGGEKQRIILARAIAQKPKLLILDEPTNHLDVHYQLQILSIVKKLGINILVALHDLSLASQFSDYIYILKDGIVHCEGVPSEVITKDMIRQVYEIDCEIYQTKQNQGILIHYYSPEMM